VLAQLLESACTLSGRGEVEVNIYSSSCPINLDRAFPWLRSMNSFSPFGALPRTNFAMSLQ